MNPEPDWQDDLIGMTVDEADEYAAEFSEDGCHIRAVKREDQPLISTRDYRQDRLNVEIDEYGYIIKIVGRG